MLGLQTGSAEVVNKHDLFIGTEDIVGDQKVFNVIRTFIDEFERQSFKTKFNDCFSAKDGTEFQKRMCTSFEVSAVAPNGIVEITLEMPRMSGPVQFNWTVNRAWRSGFLVLIAEAAQKKVECVWCASHDNFHSHAFGSILGIRVAAPNMVHKIVEYAIKVDQKTLELKEKMQTEIERLSQEVNVRDKLCEKTISSMKSDIIQLQLDIENETTRRLAFAHQKEADFSRHLATM